MLTTVIIEGKGGSLCVRSNGGRRVLKRTEDDNAHGDKVAMLHELLKLTNRLMAPFSTHLSHRYKISINEFRLLMTIGALGRTASHELAEMTGVNVMSVSRAVATLERHGRIEVVPDPRNRRRKWISLTEEGRKLRERASQRNLVKASGFPMEDFVKLQKQVTKLRDNLLDAVKAGEAARGDQA